MFSASYMIKNINLTSCKSFSVTFYFWKEFVTTQELTNITKKYYLKNTF